MTTTEETATTPDPTEQLDVEFTIDATAYRPGQVVLTRVKVSNPGPPVMVRALDRKSVEFYFGPRAADVRFLREPAFSEQDEVGNMTRLETGASIERVYVHTRLTEDPGGFTATAIYRPLPTVPQSPAPPGVTAPAVDYDVRGERILERDSAGILMKEDAISICSAKAGRVPLRSDALLIRNEAGLLDWWVVLEFEKPTNSKPSDGMAWFVNPYLGAIRDQATYWEPGTRDAKPNYTINERRGGVRPKR